MIDLYYWPTPNGWKAIPLETLGSSLKHERKHPQILRGSFSAVSTATIARVGAFFRIFRDLQDLHSFAPLRPIQEKTRPKFCRNETVSFSLQQKSMNFVIFLLNFDEIFVGIS